MILFVDYCCVSLGLTLSCRPSTSRYTFLFASGLPGTRAIRARPCNVSIMPESIVLKVFISTICSKLKEMTVKTECIRDPIDIENDGLRVMFARYWPKGVQVIRNLK